MLPFRHILCPVDFSPPSLAALAAADEFARFFFARLTVLHVLAPPPPLVPLEGTVVGGVTAPDPEVEQRRHAAAEIELAETARDVVAEEVDLHLDIRHGDPAEEILAAAEDLGADLVVIATHGRSGLKRLLFGSVAEAVVRRAACPVVTIRAQAASAVQGGETREKGA